MLKILLLTALTITLPLSSCQSSPQVSTEPAPAATAAPEPDPNVDNYKLGLEQGYAAAVEAQTAKGPVSWQTVADRWSGAIYTLQNVPPDNPNYQQAQAKVAEYQKNFDYANLQVDAAYQAREAKPSTAEDYHLQGANQYMENDYMGAVASFDKAIELKPDYAQAYFNRGLTLLRLNNRAGSIQDLEKAIKLYEAQGDEGGVYQVNNRLMEIKAGLE